MIELRYKKGYKYQLTDYFRIQLEIFPEREVKTDWITFFADGVMLLKKGYAYDGPSGPAIDTPTFMIPSGIHDAGYELIRLGLLPLSFRSKFDKEMQRLSGLEIEYEKGDKIIRTKMCKARRFWTYYGVKWFARRAASTRRKRKTMIIRLTDLSSGGGDV